MNAKHVFVSGGVASSLGKGIISAFLAKLLQTGIAIRSIAPDINIDLCTLNLFYLETMEAAMAYNEYQGK